MAFGHVRTRIDTDFTDLHELSSCVILIRGLIRG